MGLIKLNLWYIAVVNSCDRKTFMPFVDKLLTIKNGFTRKLYIWNIIRGKGFYKDLAQYVISLTEDVLSGKSEDPTQDMHKIESVITGVMESESKYEVRRSFIWQITKAVPLLTMDTVAYMSSARLTNILTSEKRVVNCDALSPFIDEIYRLRQRIHELTEETDEY